MSHLRTRRLFSPDGQYLAYGGADMKLRYGQSGMLMSLQLLLLVQTFKMVCNRTIYPSRIISLNVSILTFHSSPTNLLAHDEQGPNDPYNAFFAVSLVLSTNRTSTDHHSG